MDFKVLRMKERERKTKKKERRKREGKDKVGQVGIWIKEKEIKGVQWIFRV